MARYVGNDQYEMMKRLKALGALATILLAACATVPVQGEAVECNACRTMWIQLCPSSGAPGLYRLNHQEKSKPCVDCQKSAMAYFQTGKTPAKCLGCGGTLTVRPVNVTP
jgi:hypothetical protein